MLILERSIRILCTGRIICFVIIFRKKKNYLAIYYFLWKSVVHSFNNLRQNPKTVWWSVDPDVIIICFFILSRKNGENRKKS